MSCNQIVLNLLHLEAAGVLAVTNTQNPDSSEILLKVPTKCMLGLVRYNGIEVASFEPKELAAAIKAASRARGVRISYAGLFNASDAVLEKIDVIYKGLEARQIGSASSAVGDENEAHKVQEDEKASDGRSVTGPDGNRFEPPAGPKPRVWTSGVQQDLKFTLEVTQQFIYLAHENFLLGSNSLAYEKILGELGFAATDEAVQEAQKKWATLISIYKSCLGDEELQSSWSLFPYMQRALLRQNADPRHGQPASPQQPTTSASSETSTPSRRRHYADAPQPHPALEEGGLPLKKRKLSRSPK